MQHSDSLTTTHDACGGDAHGSCPDAGRRAFIRDAVATMAGIAMTLGIGRTAEAMAALPVRATRALHSVGRTHAYMVPVTDSVEIDRDNEVILVRWRNAVYAFNLSCPHQNRALRWDEGDKQFQCPKHHSKYQPSGEFIEGRATRAMDRFALHRDGNTIVVDVDSMYRQDESPAAWNAALVKLA